LPVGLACARPDIDGRYLGRLVTGRAGSAGALDSAAAQVRLHLPV